MPMKEATDFGTNTDGTKNDVYCTYCYQGGKFTLDCTMDEMIEHNLQFIDEFNKDAGTAFDAAQARTEMKKFFPYLKRWKE